MNNQQEIPFSEDRWNFIDEEGFPEEGKSVVCLVDSRDNYSNPHLFFGTIEEVDNSDYGIEKVWYDLTDECYVVNKNVIAWRYLKEREAIETNETS